MASNSIDRKGIVGNIQKAIVIYENMIKEIEITNNNVKTDEIIGLMNKNINNLTSAKDKLSSLILKTNSEITENGGDV